MMFLLFVGMVFSMFVSATIYGICCIFEMDETYIFTLPAFVTTFCVYLVAIMPSLL